MNKKYISFIGSAIVVLVLTLSVYVTFFRDHPTGLQNTISSNPQNSRQSVIVPEELRSLKPMYNTINLVQNNYLDPSRIDPRTMFIAAMHAIQLNVPEVIVREDGDKLSMRLGADEHVFSLNAVKTPWNLLRQVKQVFDILGSSISPDEVDLKEVEYAAINGMLHTLDPHSTLLPPDVYRDMKDKTQGKFGGLGIVISIREGKLTIVKILKGTPADKAKLQAGDHIMKIGEFSTVNMALNDAVNLLRGDPGTHVTVHIQRKEWGEKLRPIVVARAIVKVESTESQMLSGQIGYIRIKDFQGNTASDVDAHLQQMQKDHIKGLVLDLRNNPGGLLATAVKISDRFLKKGVIVTTAGQGPIDRDVRRARNTGDEPNYPLVVLVNSGSASASEILAGALKNHGRALIVGERTFGKGSVQLLFDRQYDGAALKLTTAQYLTPGDVSIQSVGVVPNVELLPVRADEKSIELKFKAGYRESDLSHHFDNARSISKAVSELSLPYLWTYTKQDEDTKTPARLDQEQPFKPDFAIKVARDLATKMARVGEQDVNIKLIESTVTQKTNKEDARLVQALSELNIDWKQGDDTNDKNTELHARIIHEGPIVAGTNKIKLAVTLTNNGPGTLFRALATTDSDFHPLEDRELAFGKVAPGQTIERKLTFSVPKDALSQVSDVRFSFSDSSKNWTPPPIAVRFKIDELPKPRFAYNYQINDVEGGNGDGQLQPGEKVRLIVDIDNVGEGKSAETYVSLKGVSGQNLFMLEGRETFKDLEPGQRKRAVFTFELKPQFKRQAAQVELTVADMDLRVVASEKITIPILAPIAIKDIDKTVVATKPIDVLNSPKSGSRKVAQFDANTNLLVNAETADFYRIRLDDVCCGWLPKNAVKDGETQAEEQAEISLIVNAPPSLKLEKVDSVTNTETVTIRGVATDERRVRDVYIFVDDKKVFFKPNIDKANAGQLTFEANIELKYGLNYVAVVAEETADLETRIIMTIRRDRKDGMSFLLPRTLHEDPKPLGVIPAAN